MSRSRGLIAVIAVMALTVTLVGCTDSDDLETGNFTFAFVPATTNPGAVAYDCITMDVGPIRMVPLDPDALDPLGASPQISVVSTRETLAFEAGPACPTLGDVGVPLPTGDYVFDQFSFGIVIFTQGTTEVLCPFEVSLLDFATSPTVSVGSSETNTLQITMDIDALADDAINNFCIDFFFNPLSYVTVEAP